MSQGMGGSVDPTTKPDFWKSALSTGLNIGKAAFGKSNPYLTAFGIGSSLLGLGKARQARPTMLSQDFGYGVGQTQFNPNQDLTSAMGSMQGLGREFSQSYRNMLNPGSAYNQGLFRNLRQNIGDTTSQNINQLNTSVASMGGSGMGNIYDAIQNRTGGEAYYQGMGNIMNQSASQAATFGGMGLDAYNRMGSLASGREGLQTSVGLSNTQALNQYEQWKAESEYAQSAQNADLTQAYGQNQAQGLLGFGQSMLQPWMNQFAAASVPTTT